MRIHLQPARLAKLPAIAVGYSRGRISSPTRKMKESRDGAGRNFKVVRRCEHRLILRMEGHRGVGNFGSGGSSDGSWRRGSAGEAEDNRPSKACMLPPGAPIHASSSKRSTMAPGTGAGGVPVESTQTVQPEPANRRPSRRGTSVSLPQWIPLDKQSQHTFARDRRESYAVTLTAPGRAVMVSVRRPVAAGRADRGRSGFGARG
jgi:hypothetical protein